MPLQATPYHQAFAGMVLKSLLERGAQGITCHERQEHAGSRSPRSFPKELESIKLRPLELEMKANGTTGE